MDIGEDLAEGVDIGLGQVGMELGEEEFGFDGLEEEKLEDVGRGPKPSTDPKGTSASRMTDAGSLTS